MLRQINQIVMIQNQIQEIILKIEYQKKKNYQKRKFYFIIFFTKYKKSMKVQFKIVSHPFFSSHIDQKQAKYQSRLYNNYPRKLHTEIPENFDNHHFYKNQIYKDPFKNYSINELRGPFHLKNGLQKSVNKLKHSNQRNYKSIDKPQEIKDSVIPQRNFGTASPRKRLKSQTRKSNIINEQQRITKNQEQKQCLKSISSLFHYSSKSKIAKMSNFIKYKNKPTMIFLSSKLPKDFFGESIETPAKSHPKLFVHNRNIVQINSIKKLKNNASTKLIRNSKNQDEQNLKVNFNDQNKYETNKNINQSAFTFRKKQSQQKPSILLPIISQVQNLPTPYFDHKIKLNHHNQNLHAQQNPKAASSYTIAQPKRKVCTNFTRSHLKL